MGALEPGTAPREKQRDRLSLTTWRSRKCSLLAGDEQSENSPELTELQRLEAALCAERNAWDIRRRSLPADAEGWLRGGGFAGRGKFNAIDAERYLAKAFAAIDGGRND